MKTTQIIENIKNEYTATIERYTQSINSFKEIKYNFKNLPREKLKNLQPSIFEYDFAISAMQEAKDRLQKEFGAMPFELDEELIADFDYLMDMNKEIDFTAIKITLQIHFRINSKFTIQNKDFQKLNKIITDEYRQELGLVTVNDSEDKLSELLQAHNYSKDTISLIFKTLKKSTKARLPKKSSQAKDGLYKLANEIINLSE